MEKRQSPLSCAVRLQCWVDVSFVLRVVRDSHVERLANCRLFRRLDSAGLVHSRTHLPHLSMLKNFKKESFCCSNVSVHTCVIDIFIDRTPGVCLAMAL